MFSAAVFVRACAGSHYPTLRSSLSWFWIEPCALDRHCSISGCSDIVIGRATSLIGRLGPRGQRDKGTMNTAKPTRAQNHPTQRPAPLVAPSCSAKRQTAGTNQLQASRPYTNASIPNRLAVKIIDGQPGGQPSIGGWPSALGKGAAGDHLTCGWLAGL